MVSSLLLVAALIGPQAAAQTPARPRIDPRPHTFAIGPTAGGSNFGGGVSVRVWFSEHIGVDTGVAFQRGSRYASAINRASTFQATPSLIYLFKEQNGDVGIDLRPYIGAGVNYSKAFKPEGFAAVPGTRLSGTGGQVLGGLEMSFREIDFMTISGEVAYVWLPVRFSGSQVFDGLNYEFAFHFYLK